MATLTAGNTARWPFLSAGADGTSLLAIPGATVDGVKGKTLFLINHLEYDTAGPTPIRTSHRSIFTACCRWR